MMKSALYQIQVKVCLRMPTISKEEISGLAKVFSLYIKFPKERWPEIKIAEKDDEEG
jgi:hypothetical protein